MEKKEKNKENQRIRIKGRRKKERKMEQRGLLGVVACNPEERDALVVCGGCGRVLSVKPLRGIRGNGVEEREVERKPVGQEVNTQR